MQSDTYEIDYERDAIIDYQASDTIADFHESDAFVRGIRGSIGSGKSVGCCWEIWGKACSQVVWRNHRTTKWGIVRNTYGELRTTTIATWNDWFGDITNIVYGHPITGVMEFPHPSGDGTIVTAHLVFLALDLKKDVRKLKSLEATGIWFNEASEIDYSHISMGTGRVNRYPKKSNGGFNWSGVIMDTNSPDEANWWATVDKESPDDWEFFDQPPALINTGTEKEPKFIENPEAENIENHVMGYDYYFKQLPGKAIEWVNVYILNQYGNSEPGALVYSGFGPENYTTKEFNPGLPIIFTFDFNFVPLCSALIQEDNDEIYAVDEFVIHGAEAKDAALEFVDRYKDHTQCPVYLYGDADGNKGKKHGFEYNYLVIQKVLQEAGFKCKIKVGKSNGPIKNGQNSLRAKILDATGKRSFFVNPEKCPTISKLGTIQLKGGSSFLEERDAAGVQDIGTAIRYYVNAEYPMQKQEVYHGKR